MDRWKVRRRLSSAGILIGIDRDEEALNVAKERLKDYKNVKYIHGNHDDINKIFDGSHVEGYEEFESTLLNMLELSKVLKKKKLETI